jgi:magnesium chelatase family protein
MEGRVAIVSSRAMVGLEAVPIAVEVHLTGGLPRITLVGLPEAAVRESKDRVRSAIVASGFHFPDGRLTVNLAPAELPKEGGRFDLAIAIGILAVSQHRSELFHLEETEVLGELSLDGSLRTILGALPCAAQARVDGRTLLLPRASAQQAARVTGAKLACVNSLLDAWDYFCGRPVDVSVPDAQTSTECANFAVDLNDVRGQHGAKRALEVAAAGAHHLIMVGPPGTGKTMLADRLPTILPALTQPEALTTGAVYSVLARPEDERPWNQRPYRAPHHTTSSAGLIGGGTRPRPGEISLAHNGVLFLDELGEFPRHVLEAMREPLESGRITVARANAHVEYPAAFQLIAAMNPCKCGYFGDNSNRCLCTPESVRQYQSRVSGPLLDRIDIHMVLTRAPRAGTPDDAAESSAVVRERIVQARTRQRDRSEKLNRDLTEREMRDVCTLDSACAELLETAIDKLQLSERGVGRIRRVARTIADLAGASVISSNHLGEAINLRRFGNA